MAKSQPYPTIVPYLVLKHADRFIDFTEMVFDGTLIRKHMREDEKLIMHAEVQIGDSVIMFADETPEFSVATVSLFITVSDADEVFQKALDHGATMVAGLSDQSYGRGGGIKDPFGNTWWITAPIEK